MNECGFLTFFKKKRDNNIEFLERTKNSKEAESPEGDFGQLAKTDFYQKPRKSFSGTQRFEDQSSTQTTIVFSFGHKFWPFSCAFCVLALVCAIHDRSLPNKFLGHPPLVLFVFLFVHLVHNLNQNCSSRPRSWMHINWCGSQVYRIPYYCCTFVPKNNLTRYLFLQRCISGSVLRYARILWEPVLSSVEYPVLSPRVRGKSYISNYIRKWKNGDAKIWTKYQIWTGDKFGPKFQLPLISGN